MLWLAVTADKYEFPLKIEESAKALAAAMHVSTSTISTKLMRGNKGVICGWRVRTVDEEEGEDFEEKRGKL